MKTSFPITSRILALLILLPSVACADSPADPPYFLSIDARMFICDWPKICQGATAEIHAVNPDTPSINPALAVQSLDDLRVDYLIRETQKDVNDRTIYQPRRMLVASIPTSWQIPSGSEFPKMHEPPVSAPLIFAGRYLAVPHPTDPKRITLNVQIQLLPRPDQTPPVADPNSVFTVHEMTLTLDIDPTDKPTLCVSLPFTTEQIAQCYQSDLNDPRNIPKNLPPNAVLLIKLNPVQPEPSTPGPAVPNLRTLPQTP